MANINNVVLSGSIAMDPDLRWLSEDGESGITRLGVIVRRSRKLETPAEDGSEWEETTSIFDVEVYGAFALTVARKLKKFDDVTVSGELVKDEWEDQTSGGKRSRIKITARVIDSAGLFRPKAEDRELEVNAQTQKQVPAPASQAASAQGQQQQTQNQPTSQVRDVTPEAAEPKGLTADDIPF